MKKYLRFNQLFILLLFVTGSAIGQYTGNYPNVAAFKVTTAMDSILGFEPSKAVDNSLLTYYIINDDAPAWFQIDLGSPHFIDGYGWELPSDTALPKAYIIEGSLDGNRWKEIKNGTSSAAGAFDSDLTWPGDYRFVRISITDKNSLVAFSEVYIFGYEIALPTPPLAKPATDTGAYNFTANWSKRSNAKGYILSVATDYSFMNRLDGFNELDVGNVLAYQVTGLSPVTEYFYRVKAYNAVGESSASNVVSVTTLKAPQTISFDSLAVHIYGDVNFDLNATASSSLPVSYMSSDETVATISGNTVTILSVGSTTIQAIQEGNDEYEAAIPVYRDLVVNPKALTVTGATAESKVYDGNTNAIVNAAVLEGVITGDDVSLEGANTGVFTQSDVGSGIEVITSMTITGADQEKYALVQPILTADITAKELVVTAADTSREACSANPEFTLLFSGFIESEGPEVLDPDPIAESVADENSPEGSYDITVSGGGAVNYILSYVNGTLTVTPDVTDPELTIVEEFTVQLDENGNATITSADVVTSAIDNCGVIDTTLSRSAFTRDDIGNVLVEVTISDAAGNSTSAGLIVIVEGTVGFRELATIGAKIYPNPTEGNLELATSTPIDVVKVMDMTGKTIIRRSNVSKLESFDLSGFSNGIYIFQLRAGDELIHAKVVKK